MNEKSYNDQVSDTLNNIHKNGGKSEYGSGPLLQFTKVMVQDGFIDINNLTLESFPPIEVWQATITKAGKKFIDV